MNPESPNERFLRVLKYLDAQARATLSLRLDKGFETDLKNVIKYLHSLDKSTIEGIISKQNRNTPKRNTPKRNTGWTNEELNQIELFALEELIEKEETTRTLLEDILIFRFGTPKGSMRTIGSKEKLKEKIRSLIENERSHKVIKNIGSKD